MAGEADLHLIYNSADEETQDVEPEIDIIAVHGLNFKNNPNHARSTWTWPSNGALWIRDFLPSTLKRPCRVFLFSYNSSPAMGAAAMRLDEHARMLLRCLTEKREGVAQRPLVFLCHSLGGIVVKSALVEATLDPAYSFIVRSTRLLIFFATPHLGGNYSEIGDIAAKIVRTGLGTPSNDLLDGLKAGSKDVIRRFEQSRHLPESCLVVSFYETENYKRLGLIVEKSSAVLKLEGDREKQVPLEANHSRICKFETRESAARVVDLISTELERALGLQKLREPPPENVHWVVTRNPSPLFTGRSEIVDRITNIITPSVDSPRVKQKRFVLTGIGGQGKSEVCLQTTQRVRSLFWGVFWVDVSSRVTASAGFSRIAQILGSDAKEIDQILDLLANCSAKNNWLLVLDNADNVDIDYQELMPSGVRGTILLSSRLPDCAYHNTVGHEVIGNLDEDECVTLFLKACMKPEDSWSECRASATAIARELGFHTLALVQAGTYIAAGHCKMNDYPALFRDQRDQLLRFGSSQMQARYRNVYTTFEVSLQSLKSFGEENARDALELLDLLSAMHYEDIPFEIFEDVQEGKALAMQHTEDNMMDELSYWHVTKLPEFLRRDKVDGHALDTCEVLKHLSRLALVSKSVHASGLHVVSLHPLVHSWMATRQQKAERFFFLQSSCCFFALLHYRQAQWKPYKGRLGPHLSFLLNTPSFVDEAMGLVRMRQGLLQIGYLLLDLGYHRELSNLLDKMFHHLNVSPESPTEGYLPLYFLAALNQYNLGHVKTSIDLIHRVLQGPEIDVGKFRNLKLSFEKALASAYLTDGQTKKAIALLEEMDRDLKTRISPDSPSQLSVRYRLGISYRADGQTSKARAMMEAINNVESRSLQDGDPIKATTAYELARCYLDEGHTKDAIKVFRTTIKQQEIFLPKTHTMMLSLRYGLGRALLSDFQTEAAIEILEDVNLMRTEISGLNHPSRLAGLVSLGSAYRANGQTKDAITTYEEALRLYKVDEGHPNRLDTQCELSIAYLANGQTQKAISLLERTLNLQEETLKEDHPARVRVQMELGNAYSQARQFSKAIHILGKAIEMQKGRLQDDHPNLLGAQYQLGLAYLSNDRTKEAISLFEHIVGIEESSLDESNPDKAVSKLALGRAYLSDGRTTAASKTFEEVVAVLQSTWSRSHPNVLAAQHELARSYCASGQFQRARVLFEDIIDVQATSLPPNHPDQLTSQRLLGLTLVELGQNEEAISLLATVLRIQSVLLNPDDDSLLATRRALGSAYLANDQGQEAIEQYEHVVETQSQNPASHQVSELLKSRQQLASAYLSLNRREEAIAVLEEAEASYAKELTADHVEILTTQRRLGMAYLESGQARKAMDILERVVENGAHLDDDHPSKLASQHELARCYLRVGRVEDAVSMLRGLVETERTMPGGGDASRVKSLRQLGFAYLSSRRAGDAADCFREVASIYKEVFGMASSQYLLMQSDLAVAYLDSSRPREAISILKEAVKVAGELAGNNGSMRLKLQFDLASAYLDAGKADKAIPLLEEAVAIKKGDGDAAAYPDWDQLQRTLARAYKERNVLHKLLSKFGRDEAKANK